MPVPPSRIKRRRKHFYDQHPSKLFDRIKPTYAAYAFYLLGFFLLIGAGRDQGADYWLNGIAGVAVECMSIAITVLVVERLLSKQADRERIEELVLQMGSPNNAFAIEAVRLLHGKHCFSNGTLSKAMFGSADLEGADLGYGDFEGSAFWFARLKNANFSNTNLDQVYFEEADLQGAEFEAAEFSETTLLPDRTYWTLDTDMTRFTDPTHPNFWRSDNPRSPAYKGH